jgi:hypothetical protein
MQTRASLPRTWPFNGLLSDSLQVTLQESAPHPACRPPEVIDHAMQIVVLRQAVDRENL